MLEGLLLVHAFHMPHIFGFLPVIAGALAGLGAGAIGIGSGLAIAGTGITIGAGAVLGTAGAALGYSGMKSASAARKQAQASNDAAQRQFWYNTENWNLTKDRLIADHKHLTEQWKIKTANEQRSAAWGDATKAADYAYRLQIRNAEQQSLNEQFTKSENIYGDQIDLNKVSAENARDQELRKLEETRAEAAFEAEDNYLESIKAEGELRSKGVEGRSVAKGKQATLADYGRQMALISESLSSAGRNTAAVLKDIERDKFSADLIAYSNKMLKPGKIPMPVIPFKTPIADFQNPRALQEFDYGAKPVIGAQYDANAASQAVWGQTISSIASPVVGSILGKALKF